jgi:dihydroorotate dehydrogenase electron transfer subunit
VKQVQAEVIHKPEQLLKELERPYAGTIHGHQARNISGSWIIWFNCPDIAREAQPGQFVMVRCGEQCILPRPFSIHQIKNESDVALFFAAWEDGKGTRWLSERKQGNIIEMLGPLGNGFSINPGSQNLLLIAGGIGIAPLFFLAMQARERGYSVRLLRGASGEFKTSGEKNKPQHYPEELFPQGIELETITSSPYGKTGMVLELLSPKVVDWADQIFACGPTPMYRAMAAQKQQLLAAKSVQVSLEMRMGCGLGTCYGCTLRTKHGLKQVCKDGPVFELDDIFWDDPAFNF